MRKEKCLLLIFLLILFALYADLDLSKLEEDADSGIPDAQYSLGMHYYAEQNYEEAYKWFLLASKQNFANAQNELGKMYEYGQGMEQNYEEAKNLYTLSAEKGCIEAMFNLATLYSNGCETIPQDNLEALKWYKLAANNGLAQAQCNLGYYYLNGTGCKKNTVEALKWYKASANQGYSDALYQLGTFYSDGENTPKNYKEAYKWFLLVTTYSDDELLSQATYDIKQLLKKMNQTEISAAMQEVRLLQKQIDDKLYNGLDNQHIKEQQTIRQDEILSIKASSFLKNNEPQKCFDGSPSTAWVEGKKDSGIGEWIKCEFKQPYTLTGIMIVPGYDKYNESLGYLWSLNNQVKEIKVTFSDGSSQAFLLKEKARSQYLLIDGIKTSSVVITIKNIYNGTLWNDTAISTVQFYHK